MIAEAIDCPVAGYTGIIRSRDEAVEGQGRAADKVVLKSHHPYEVFQRLRLPGNVKLVFIVRDPRDVAVSGMRYFYSDSRYSETNMLNRMLPDAVPFDWNSIGWSEYVMSYLNADMPHIKYEDLLADTENELKRVLCELDIGFQEDRIHEAVKNQSFAVAKARYQKTGDKRKLEHMGSGKAGSFRGTLSQHTINTINREMSAAMSACGFT
ncbi:sulfotransferase domain-containing protein [Hoeflea poritis]|uniref:sulfotransferase domain-containing protein n=1 Tax=Hoeflea poritis TaxID=2993659 RepID=UPI002FDBE5A3